MLLALKIYGVLVKSLLFWMISFLRKQYESVEIRFIQHTDRALEVDEDTFFYGGDFSVSRKEFIDLSKSQKTRGTFKLEVQHLLIRRIPDKGFSSQAVSLAGY